MSKSSKGISLIAATLAFVVAGGIFFYFYRTIGSVNAHIGELTAQVTQNSKKEEQLRSLKALFADTASQRGAVDTYFIGQDGVVPFLERLETLGKETGVDLEVSSVSVEKSDAPQAVLEKVPLTLSIAGSFTAVMRFINLLEKIPIPGELTLARLDRAESGKTFIWKASITGSFSKIK